MTPTAGVALGRLLLALDATLVSLVEAPRGLDVAVASTALVDADDVRLGLAARPADAVFLLGLSETDALSWLAEQSARAAPTAIFVKAPAASLVARARAAGAAVIAVDPRARWERLYRLVDHVLEHHGDRTDPRRDSGTDLFGLAQSIAERTHGMVSIEDAGSHVLAYSASADEADELRRLSILGRAGPPEHLAWIGRAGIFTALRRSGEVVAVAARPELGLAPRRAVGIHLPVSGRRRAPGFAGTIWVQQGSRALAADADEVLRGAAVLAARVMARLAATPSTHAMRVRDLLGLGDGAGDGSGAGAGNAGVGADALARELGIATTGRATVVGFAGRDGPPGARMADALALNASAFRHDAQVASDVRGTGERAYVLFGHTGDAVTSWIRGTLGALRRELDLDLRAVLATPPGGLAGIAAARAEVDRVLDSAARHPGSLGAVTSLAEARTTVLLDEIVTLVAADDRLLDPRARTLRDADPALADTLRAYLDEHGDVGATARALHVHPNTVRYRLRRIEEVAGVELTDADTRLLLALSLRALD